ncbi:hypothetical protein [uncultured Paludibaculum sp.]|uniref:hypothetical protein n=1 Tax=uncultured Paludibaculum sp. TaxID=1765020 RepID=UPI002AAAD89D|nr:hypothetical protein [uncultured Paludibaculum sp.]
MKRGSAAGWAFVTVLALLAIGAGYWARKQNAHPATTTSPEATAPTASAAEEAHPSFLYGRITTVDGVTYEGRLRWGRGEEAFWGDYFNGAKKENPWAALVPPERRPKERRPIAIFGLEIAHRERPVDLTRLFMARFGDIARIEASGRDVRVTLKSGTGFYLDRFSASDFDDGVRVWDGARGVADLDSLRIRAIELLPAPRSGAAVGRLHGTVRTRQGEEFSGFVQWDREQCVGSDQLTGHTAGGERSVRFEAMRSIARRSDDSSLVTLLDGREVVLSGTRAVGQGNRGVYVDDLRYGRVLVSWGGFERVEFTPDGSGPAYGDFPPGGPLTGTITTRDGRHLTGRLVYDLDESEFTETLDAPSRGVDYTIPFGLIASIVRSGAEERGAQCARVTLRSGQELQLDCAGDLGQGNAGMLVYVADGQRPEYVSWTDVVQVALNRPPAMYPPLDRR